MSPQPGKPALLRTLNDRRALELLFAHGPLTRGRIGELSGLSKPTATQVVQRLEALGLVGPVARVSGGRGPDAVAYGLVADGNVGVAIDARAHRLAAVVIDVLGTELAHVEASRTVDGPVPAGAAGTGGPEELAALVDRACEAAGAARRDVRLAVIGVSAAVDEAGDTLRFAEDFPRWPVGGVRRRLVDALACDVVLDNDVKLAAVAERDHGVARDAKSFSILWMGQGVGLATDLAGEVVRGSDGAAGEIGYLRTPAATEADDPVEPPTFHHLLSASAVLELGRRCGISPAAGTGTDDALAEVLADDRVVETLARRVAECAAPVLAVLDPEMLVLAGPVAVRGGDRLAARVDELVSVSSPWRARVAPTGLPSGAVLEGARVALLRRLRAGALERAGTLD
ncbi:ROK family transcriptional regulator [Luteimicrobium xylanilyticum]|uniref:Glucokinase n=1 Tax=Luteimicrobium xylanilyticum TaxID=1133546 RepID=A0A5P9Q8G9_9MICO|nr:ROK family transcriptional regulator [Luteimicrobium xylanilyticum]QFU97748.1 Glucokinase [Luteimicrobium xylanilyticum]